MLSLCAVSTVLSGQQTSTFLVCQVLPATCRSHTCWGAALSGKQLTCPGAWPRLPWGLGPRAAWGRNGQTHGVSDRCCIESTTEHLNADNISQCAYDCTAALSHRTVKPYLACNLGTLVPVVQTPTVTTHSYFSVQASLVVSLCGSGTPLHYWHLQTAVRSGRVVCGQRLCSVALGCDDSDVELCLDWMGSWSQASALGGTHSSRSQELSQASGLNALKCYSGA